MLFLPIFRYCAAALLLTAPATAQLSLTPEQWREDLAFLARELPARHPHPFAHITKAAFDKQVADLQAQIPKLDESGIRTGFQKIVAGLGDPHTRIVWDLKNSSGTLPLKFYWFPDGIYLVGASEPYRKMLGGRLLRISQTKVDDVIKRLTPLIPAVNESFLKTQIPSAMVTVDYLAATGITTSLRAIPIAVEMPSGKEESDYVGSVPVRVVTPLVSLMPANPPLYRRNEKKNYGAINAASTIYFQCNRGQDDPQQPFAPFRKAFSQLLAVPGNQRLVVDLRNYREGAPALLDPLIDDIKASSFNRKGSLFVIVSRVTASGGLSNAVRLADETAATLVGETPAEEPAEALEVQPVRLPHTQIQVLVLKRLVAYVSRSYPILEPEISAQPTSKDFAGGEDPALDAILTSKPAELLAQSEQRYKARIAADKSDFRACERLSRIYSTEHRDDDLRQLWQRAMDANASNVEFLVQAGGMYFRDRNLPRAEIAYRAAASKDSSNSPARGGLLEVLLAENKPGEAVEFLSPLLTKYPNDTDLHDQLARAALAAKQFDLAVSEYQKVAAAPGRRPADIADTYSHIGSAYADKGDLVNSIASYRKSLDRVPDDLRVLVALATVFEHNGQPHEAVKVYRSTLELQPDNPVLLNNIAYLLANNGGDLSEALRYATHAFDLTRGNPSVADTLAWVFVQREEFNRAAGVLRDVVDAAPDVVEYHYHLAFALSKTGDRIEARQQLKEALKLNPTPDERKRIDALMKELSK
jgi:Flp pilus assembly protein TadD